MAKKNKFQFLTYAGFYIETSEDFHILIDPYLDDNINIDMTSDAFERVDLILVSHGPSDHVGDTAKLAKKHGCKVLCPDDVKWLLIDDGVPAEQIIAMCWGLAVEIGKIRIKGIENHHRSVVRLKNGQFVSCPPCNYIVTLEDGTRIYNSGDTALFSDMKLQGELYRPHIGLINVSADFIRDPDYCCGEMSPYEAALASHWLGVDTVLACHYVNINDAGLKEYLQIMDNMKANKSSPIVTVALAPGECYEYSCKKGEL